MNMSLCDSDELKKLIHPIPLDNRNLLWLDYWLISELGFPEGENLSTLKFSDQIRRTLYYAKNNPSLLANAKSKFTNSILSEKYFSWMREGPRLDKWLSYKSATKLPVLAGSRQIPIIDSLIMKIDLWDETKLTKEYFLSELQSGWKNHKSNDKMYIWFDCNEKINLADEWLDRNKPTSHPYGTPKPKIHDKESLITYFENHYSDTTEIKFLIDKIRKRWSQNNYRSSEKGKSQKNLLLSSNSLEALIELSRKHEISQSRVIEILIEMEYKNQLYIPLRIEETKLLMTDTPSLDSIDNASKATNIKEN